MGCRAFAACPMHMNAHGHTAPPSRDQISLDDQGEQNKKNAR